MITNENPKEYQAYLVRIWPVRNTEGLVWRASITNARTSESQGFANMEELFDYLRDQTYQESKPKERRQ
jgi:hypothetical protein